MLDGMTYCWNIFDKYLFFGYISFKLKFSILLFTVIFTHFYNVFALDSLKISFAYQAPDNEHGRIFYSEYNNENMRFIRLLLANQITYIFGSNDKIS